MTLLLLTAGVIAYVMLLMSVGVLLNNRCLRGTCGGEDVLGPDGEPEACPQRKERAGTNPPVKTGRA